jgi:hypothetical protein
MLEASPCPETEVRMTSRGPHRYPIQVAPSEELAAKFLVNALTVHVDGAG